MFFASMTLKETGLNSGLQRWIAEISPKRLPYKRVKNNLDYIVIELILNIIHISLYFSLSIQERWLTIEKAFSTVFPLSGFTRQQVAGESIL